MMRDHCVIELSLPNNSFLRADDHGGIATGKSIGYRKGGVARLYQSKASLSGRLVEEVDTQDKLKWGHYHSPGVKSGGIK